MPQNPSLQWAPPALTAAAGPLAEARGVLRALSDDHAGIAVLADGSPTPGVRDALEGFLSAYSLVLYGLSVTAGTLATNLKAAAFDYVGTEQALTDQGLAAAHRQVR